MPAGNDSFRLYLSMFCVSCSFIVLREMTAVWVTHSVKTSLLLSVYSKCSFNYSVQPSAVVSQPSLHFVPL